MPKITSTGTVALINASDVVRIYEATLPLKPQIRVAQVGFGSIVWHIYERTNELHNGYLVYRETGTAVAPSREEMDSPRTLIKHPLGIIETRWRKDGK